MVHIRVDADNKHMYINPYQISDIEEVDGKYVKFHMANNDVLHFEWSLELSNLICDLDIEFGN